MDATCYLVLIEVHLRGATFRKGQRLTLDEMGPYAFTLLHYSLARLESEIPIALPIAA
ncbi:MAG: hypothetical protein ACHQ50_01390 [Fimbriimonadales bacterium]